MNYDHRKIEPKWQKKWEKEKIFEVKEDSKKEKFYILDMFPYPSGAGLHVGHPEGYTATDIIARKRRMEGFSVLHPMGWDAFGLPAENYAIKTGTHPSVITKQNIDNFRRQIKALGMSYDWSREVDTTDPEYYRWTQWIFLKLFEKGLAYEAEMPINWCPADKTGLANEEVVNGKCDRCGAVVEKKLLRQWLLKITAYADRLEQDLDGLDWPEKIKTMQRNWIGRSEGAEIDFRGTSAGSVPDGKEFTLPVFTTRPDTLLGVTFVVLAPEHPLVNAITAPAEKNKVSAYLAAAEKKSEIDRTGEAGEKTGVFTGAYVRHPLTDEPVPVWVGDYVLPQYGTGAVMGVPAHDDRDYAFAKKYGVGIKFVIAPSAGVPHDDMAAYTAPGIMVNSGEWDGLSSEDAKVKITDALIAAGRGRRTVNYKLRDWLFSRQRYWGEPIPIIHCSKCGNVAVPEKDLPVKLPSVEKYEPSGTGESPLVNIAEWVNVKCPRCGGPGKRETNTMPQWAGSSWYYIRYCDPHSKKSFALEKALKHWLPVDYYVGGAEHAVLHLLYSRFWHKALFDLGFVPGKEPFKKLANQGLILAEDGTKMSKSKGNVVNPDDIVERFGADALRVYLMFMGPFEDAKPWSTASIIGVRRFLDRAYAFAEKADPATSLGADADFTRVLHQTIRKVSEDIEAFKFNTAVSQMMIFLNEAEKREKIPAQSVADFILLLSPFAPHLGEELWSKLGRKGSTIEAAWPKYDASLAAENEITLVVQVNGKLRDKLVVTSGLPDAELEAKALALPKIQEWIKGKKVVKVIVAKGKLVNIVVV
jgi:leucyl-tRNA synthetase